MSTASSARAVRRFLVRPRNYLVVGLLVALSLVLARAAYAATVYSYYSAFANPGVPHDSAGWNDRLFNNACRDDPVYESWGIARVADYNGSGVKVADSGTLWTQCQGDILVSLDNDGYFLTRCWNSDSVGMILRCRTTHP